MDGQSFNFSKLSADKARERDRESKALGQWFVGNIQSRESTCTFSIVRVFVWNSKRMIY